MKHLTTLATISVLAASSWAAGVPGHRAVPVATPDAFFLQGGACPTPATVDATKFTWKHSTAEYNDFTALTKATDKAQQAQLAAAFIQKYPDSDYKNEALNIQVQAESNVPSMQAKAVQDAEALAKAPNATAAEMLVADTIVSFYEPNLVQPNDPDMAAKMATLTQAATCGQQLLSSAPAAQQAQLGPIMVKAQGFAQLNTKDYDAAITTLSKAAAENPKDALPYYWMGIAEVTKATPDFNTGLFDLAKASVLAPQTAAFKSYLDTVYKSYHGTADGEQDVITAATNNNTPPAGFKVLSSADVQNAANMAAYNQALEAQKNTLPPEDSFPGIEARLKRPDLATDMWKKTKGTGLELDGLVTEVTARSVDLAVGATDATKNTPADLHVILAAPLNRRPKIGEKVTVDGVAESYKPNPPDANGQFVLTLNQGSVKGFSPVAKPGPGGEQKL